MTAGAEIVLSPPPLIPKVFGLFVNVFSLEQNVSS